MLSVVALGCLPADGLHQTVKGDIYKTTYTDTYRSIRALPPIKYSQPPSLCGNSIMQPPRQFPLIPRGPHRKLAVETPLAPGLGTADLNVTRYLDVKPIVRMPAPSERTFDLPSIERSSGSKKNQCERVSESLQILPLEVLDSLCHHLAYTSTTRRATEEAKITATLKVEPPTSTFEENADQVVYRPQMYEADVEDWQQVAKTWDRAQTRPRIDRPVLNDKTTAMKECSLRPRTLAKKCVPEEREQYRELALVKDRLNMPFIRRTPGYAGFVPRSIIEPSRKHKKERPSTDTVMQASYRPFPEFEYKIRKHAHKGPMSRTVTLTYPYNPFNKVES